MGGGGRLAGRDALDEMGRAVADMLAKLSDPPPSAERLTVTERSSELPDLAEADAKLAAVEAGWADWRRRLAALVS